MLETATPTRCPVCGSKLSRERKTEGLCPACVLELALESPSLLDELENPDEDATLVYSREAYSPGQVLGKRYRIRSLLGRGGMGEVWRASDLKLRVDVALKALRRQLLEDTRALETLRQEVRVAREVMSPNVCRVFDLVELDGQELVSMEYIDGITLLDILKMRAPLDLTEAREIASQFLAGLQAIHDAGLVHRDVKPENLMMTRSGRVVLMDFGIAKGLAEGITGTISGTPAYMAPEQGRGEALDARADVFSAGVVLAEMIAPGGLKSFEARQQIWQGIHHEPPEVADSPWTSVLGKAVARQKQQRHASAAALARALEEVTLRVAGAEDLTPYPGLAAFTEADAEYFFGRELEVEEMWKKLQRPHLLGLMGPSGAGKSSFLRAGLLPVIPSGWRAIVTTPGARPMTALARALVPELSGDTEALQLLTSPDDVEALTQAVTLWRQQHDETLLIVDQFEELFTQNPSEVQEQFSKFLGRLALEADVHVLVSMRDDFLAYCSHQESLNPIFSELTPLKPLTGGAVRRALVQPAVKCGYRFEDDGLVDEMVGEVGNERGALPMLAFAASRLWDYRDRDEGLLAREAYEHIGGVGGALAQHAEQTLERIGQDRVPIVRELFRNLVTAQGTRAARDRDELLSVFAEKSVTGTLSAQDKSEAADTAKEVPVTDFSAAEVLDALIDARLLTSYEVPAADEEGAEPHHRIEIIHESLLSNWPRLVRWQTQDADSAQLRDQIRQAAQMWEERGRPQDLLWTGTSFGEYQLWRDRYEGGLSTAEEDFGDAMVHRAERQKRRRRRVITAVFCVMLAVLGVITYLLREAVLERRRAEAGKLLALGEVELDSYPTATLAWATKSLELADTLEGRLLALRALQQGPPVTVMPEGAWRLAFSPSGEWLGGQTWLRPQDGRPAVALGPFEASEVAGKPTRLAFASESSLVTDQNGLLQWWSVPDGKELRKEERESGRLDFPTSNGYFSFTRDQDQDSVRWWPFEDSASRLLGTMDAVFADVREGKPAYQTFSSVDVDTTNSWLAYSRDSTVYVRSLEDWSHPPRRVGEHQVPVVEVAFHPDGELIAAIDESAEIRIWSLTATSERPLRSIQADAVYLIQIDPSGRWLIGHEVVDGQPTVRLWDMAAPQGVAPLTLQRSDVIWSHQAVAHPTRPWLVTAHGDDAAFWPLSGRYPWVLHGHTELVRKVAFTPDGDWLISAAHEGVRAWPLRGQNGGASRVLIDRVLGIVPTIDVHPSGRLLAVGSQGGVALVVPIAGGPVREFSESDSTVPGTLVAFSPSGRLLATVPESGPKANMTVRLWHLESGEVQDVAQVLGESAYLDFVDESHLTWIGSGGMHQGESGGERVFDLDTGETKVLTEDSREMARAVSESGTFAITVEYRDDTWYQMFWRDLETGESRQIVSHGNAAGGPAIDPSDQWIATGDYFGVVRVGRVTGEEPHLLLGHRGNVGGVAFSPDGRWIASGGDDGTVRLWPTPDFDRPPFHTLPHNELMAKLHSLTNLRVVEDPESSSGWKIDYGPFPGWEEVPEW